MKTYTLIPKDLLFFRDGRPMETSGGHGARWPEPSIIFNALHAALWRAFPQPQPWEHLHDFGRSSFRPRNGNNQRFGSLTTAGLFPVWKDQRWLFPAPADVVPSDPNDKVGWLLYPQEKGHTNLPAEFLSYTVGSYAKPSKDFIPPWWTVAAWQAYLEGNKPAPDTLFHNEDLFAGEWTTGIGIDPRTQTQDGEHIYSAEYLRLRPEVRCGFIASLLMKQNAPQTKPEAAQASPLECIQNLFCHNDTIIVGGQQRPCKVEAFEQNGDGLPLPKGRQEKFNESNGKVLLKWVMLTPAIWPEIRKDSARNIAAHPGGWLPNWVCPTTGKVFLKAGPLDRQPGESRDNWRRRVRQADSINARLVAAVVPKPITVTGWTERLHLLQAEPHWNQNGRGHGPRPTHLAVPAGAVYYFEADSAEDAEKLAAALNWHGGGDYTRIKNRRSTLLGEQGFGLGVCGTWTFYPFSKANVSEHRQK
ncbi:MAG: hypothetical protein N3J91_07540 [Verrucomicrobiae bacterium]|nr:hypothetical protein [Verrucomicrobiae bacterium]